MTRRERGRRALRAASSVLIAVGVLLVADAAATVTWQEPVTALSTALRQGQLDDDLRALRDAGPTPLELEALRGLEGARRRTAFLARGLRARVDEGDAVARLRIPSIGLSKVVVDGTAPGDLRKGPGFYPQLGLPGAPGTAAIAGHRTTYGAPFRHLDDVAPGDRIELELPYGRFTYRVQERKVVEPDDVSVLERRPYDRLVLSACHPLFSAAQRIVVLARLVRTEPAGAVSGRAS
ncbi:sortase [Conexibacter sp. SYSU D00693]|uniref:sortase n=1 Tax=Conexibacter sp. SYSU D00693 TaxID=2812560 RepID=UPI00196AD7A9|nr:class E sortase [Conexibacter sp. SYSU D00693]